MKGTLLSSVQIVTFTLDNWPFIFGLKSQFTKLKTDDHEYDFEKIGQTKNKSFFCCTFFTCDKKYFKKKYFISDKFLNFFSQFENL